MLDILMLNRENGLFRCYTNTNDAEATMDLVRFYSPYGIFKRNYSYFGPGGILQMYASFTENYDVDYILNKLFGTSSLNTDFDKSLNVGGKGISLNQAFISTISEMAERLFGSLAYLEKKDQLIYGTYRELTNSGRNCLGPKDIDLFAEEQYKNDEIPYTKFTEDSFLGWIEGERLFSNEKIWVPAQLILLFYMSKNKEDSIGYSTSGGLASNVGFKETVYRGITELIERDAVNIRWTSNIAPEKIILDRKFSDKNFNRFIDKAIRLGDKLNFYKHSLDITVPVISAVQINKNYKRYAFVAGGGVDVELEKAMFSAFKEYGQSLEPILFSLSSPKTDYANGMRRMLEVSPEADIRNIDHFFKIMSYYGYENKIADLRSYLHDGKEIKLSDYEEAIQKKNAGRDKYSVVYDELKKNKIDPIFFDFTPNQMEHNKIIKVFIPELAPPYLHSKPFYGHRRYYEVPLKLGYAKNKLTYGELNKKAIPYP